MSSSCEAEQLVLFAVDTRVLASRISENLLVLKCPPSAIHRFGLGRFLSRIFGDALPPHEARRKDEYPEFCFELAPTFLLSQCFLLSRTRFKSKFVSFNYQLKL